MGSADERSADERSADERSGGLFDVAIVGAGPVGTALAILLAQRGRSVVVLERRPHPYPLPRAVHFDDEVGRILQSCGLGDRLAAISEAAEVYEWRNAAGATLLRFGRRGNGPSGWPQSSMFNQPALEGLLADRSAELGVEVRRGVEVTALTETVTGAAVGPGAAPGAGVANTVTLHGPLPDTTSGPLAEARFVVGCDGANSSVRSLIGATVNDLGFFYDWLIVDVILDPPRTFDPLNVQICDPARPSTAVSGGPGRRRWEFMRLPGEERDDLAGEDAAWRLLAPWDVTPDNATLERHAVYTFQARWVEQWRRGRVLLAGDAAHQMPPFAGQGLCAGLRDAANLAWKLDTALDLTQDTALDTGSGFRAGTADTLLDSYELERRDQVRAVIDFSMALGQIICVPDAEEAAARDIAMSESVVDGQLTEVPPLAGLTAGVLHRESPMAGSLSIQGPIGPDGARFDDVHGAGWRLVATPALAGPVNELLDRRPDLADAFERVGGRVVGLVTADRAYLTWFEEHAVVAVLQRPDFHVYGSVARDESSQAVDAARAVLLLEHALAWFDSSGSSGSGGSGGASMGAG